DLDWEFPSSSTIAAWVALVADLRTALDAIGPGLTISTTLGSSPSDSDIYPAASLATLDWVSAMTYAYANPSSDVVGYYAPLRAPAGASSVDATITHLVGRGVPASKLLLGIGF